MNVTEIEKVYSERIQDFKNEELRVRKRLLVLSFLRFFSFIIAITLFVLLFKGVGLIKLFGSLLFLALFIIFVIHYFKQTDLLNHYKNLIKINSEEKEVLNNNYSFFNDGADYINRDHPYSYDLDIFGNGSLFQYLNRTFTIVGRDLLAKRLLNLSFKKQEIENRHEAIKELSSEIDWRQNVMATGYSTPISVDDNKKIQYWIDKPIYFINKLFYKALVILLPVVTITFLLLLIFGVAHYAWFMLLGLTQLFIASSLMRKTNKEQRVVSEGLRTLKKYSKILKFIEDKSFDSKLLNNLKSEIETDNQSAGHAFKKLIKIIDAFDTRLNIFLGVILNATLMWDLYSMIRLEMWKRKYGSNLNKWIKVIAEFDLLSSVANFKYNNPDFIYPGISDKTIFSSLDLGHPLIPYKKRVPNDFSLNKSGEMVIITGANMAGKSTFLRTIGINIILAMNGMPVCASDFKFKLTDIFSGMRTADSLNENESYFYAELKRLKYIIEKLKQKKQSFILLDEILKGTNSVDKAKGSWKFVEHLTELKATGVIATHDLTLCDLETKYPENIINKCFEVQIDKNKIKFDYKLHSGVTQNMNASLLMQQMGIFSK
jgi:ABC-type multidrug transport system fused ATPase/permease subunit